MVLPFNKFAGVDPILGPEMRSTGEVMGVGATFAQAFAKAMLGSSSTMKKKVEHFSLCAKVIKSVLLI